MKNWAIHSIPVVGILLFVVGWKFMYPWLGYMLDSDAVGYLTVAERVARGDFFTSINALWSPLNSWLLLIYSHSGMNFFFRAQLWNLVIGMVLLGQLWWLNCKLGVGVFLRGVTQLTLSVVMIYMVYYQVFADLLQCVFVLTYLLWLLHRDNKNAAITAVVAGVIIGIAFYAKAYSWFFFVLHFTCMQAIYFFTRQYSGYKATINGLLGITSSLIVMFPWIYAIKYKFGVWSITGLSGKLNMSWYINSGKTFKDSIRLLIPPTYSDSPSFWEDPFPSQGVLTGPFSDLSAFIHWIARCIHTVLSAITCYTELSVFALFCIGWGVYHFLWLKRNTTTFMAEKMLVLALFVLPLGYLTMHIETRYLWLSLFLLPIVFDRFINSFTSLQKNVLTILWSFAFLVFPLLQIEQLREKNKDLFEEALRLKQYHFTHESFTSSVVDAGRMWVVAYLTKSHYYTIEASTFKEEELIQEMKRYQIKWYLQEKEKCNDGLHFEGNEHWAKQFETSRFVAFKLID